MNVCGLVGAGGAGGVVPATGAAAGAGAGGAPKEGAGAAVCGGGAKAGAWDWAGTAGFCGAASGSSSATSPPKFFSSASRPPSKPWPTAANRQTSFRYRSPTITARSVENSLPSKEYRATSSPPATMRR